MADLTIKLDVHRVVAVERYAGKTLNEILRDVESEAGMSLTVLRGMLAAGTQPGYLAAMEVGVCEPDRDRADALLARHGIAACAAAAGAALAHFLRSLEKPGT
ncbi:hypothetical protein [Ancylobacter pratisalsi]|uniref:Gene transfer agent family protein n=1 Tax=Ancylobacter pratisalsi TaxID=1745854 RepID=A0A6P1YV50_9HYPH|nr:hypothetical protein [Ancylobacter pratisalsi]QIB36546.1 hypothetical protein G3A50_22280 [Ancylobacter pratisalsi]